MLHKVDEMAHARLSHVNLIPSVVEQLLLLLHEGRLLGKEAHTDRLDVLQVLHVDALHLRQHKLILLFFFLIFITLILLFVDFNKVIRAGGRGELWGSNDNT